MKKTKFRPHATFYAGKIDDEKESSIKYKSVENKAQEMEKKLKKMYAASKSIKTKKITSSNQRKLYFNQEDKAFLT